MFVATQPQAEDTHRIQLWDIMPPGGDATFMANTKNPKITARPIANFQGFTCLRRAARRLSEPAKTEFGFKYVRTTLRNIERPFASAIRMPWMCSFNLNTTA
jgi:hypothetical protein